MKFKITRTSDFNGDKKPCNQAIKESYTRVEIRTLGSFEKFDEKFGKQEGKWLSKGINHCINNMGYIQREFPNESTGWFIEVDTLDELIDFCNKHGDVIITRAWDNKNIYELEIYDDYRE